MLPTVRNACRGALFAFSLTVIGCMTSKTLEPGMYLGSESPGWKLTRPNANGDEQLYRVSSSEFAVPPSVAFFGEDKGHVDIYTSYLSLEDHIIVTFNDSGEQRTIKVDGSDTTLAVGESIDFTIVILPHGRIPRFEARLRWSDKPVYAYRYNGL